MSVETKRIQKPRKNRKTGFLGLSSLCKFIKIHYGFGSKQNVGTYELVAKILLEHGKTWTNKKESDRTFVRNNDEYIGEFLMKYDAERHKNKKKTYFEVTKTSTVTTVTKSVLKPKKTGIDPCSDKFLESYEWRVVRMKALKLHGARCQCCGQSPKDGIVLNVDHIKPRKTHPELALSVENLQVLCHECNHGKGNWDDTDWR